MNVECPECHQEVLDIDVKCPHCDTPLAATGAHKMIGQTMLGQYELVEVLGQGGMSVVFKGRHQLTDQAVALKILPPELAAHSQVKSRFLEEAKALAALDHPNIVHLYNFGQENGYFVLAMQFVEGVTWERMILEAGKLDWRPSCRIACDVLRALEYAHGRGVIHRDMKPSNVLVRAHDGSATVMDFGIAKMTTSTRLTATGQTMGTVRYMSPEQVRGQEVDPRTDIYSLGATLYESVTGDTPFDGATHFEIMTKHLSDPPKRPSVMGIAMPTQVEDAIMRCLAKRAEDRFESPRAMRKILEAALRASDPGLVDTQRVSGSVLSEVRSSMTPRPERPSDAASKRPSARRIATANELGESGPDLEPPVRRRSPWPWLALALLVFAGGAVALVLVMRGAGSTKDGGPFAALSLQPAVTVDGLRVITDGSVDASSVARSYRDAFAAAQKRVDDGLAAKHESPATLHSPAEELYAVPQSALCMKSAYVADDFIPKHCDTALYAISQGGRTGGKAFRIYVVSSRIEDGLRSAVGDIVCSAKARPDQRDILICDLARGTR